MTTAATMTSDARAMDRLRTMTNQDGAMRSETTNTPTASSHAVTSLVEMIPSNIQLHPTLHLCSPVDPSRGEISNIVDYWDDGVLIIIIIIINPTSIH